MKFHQIAGPEVASATRSRLHVCIYAVKGEYRVTVAVGDVDHRRRGRTEGNAMIPVVNSLWEHARWVQANEITTEPADEADLPGANPAWGAVTLEVEVALGNSLLSISLLAGK